MTTWITTLALALAGLWVIETVLLVFGYRANCRAENLARAKRTAVT